MFKSNYIRGTDTFLHKVSTKIFQRSRNVHKRTFTGAIYTFTQPAIRHIDCITLSTAKREQNTFITRPDCSLRNRYPLRYGCCILRYRDAISIIRPRYALSLYWSTEIQYLDCSFVTDTDLFSIKTNRTPTWVIDTYPTHGKAYVI